MFRDLRKELGINARCSMQHVILMKYLHGLFVYLPIHLLRHAVA
jgi:hypothetical protein